MRMKALIAKMAPGAADFAPGLLAIQESLPEHQRLVSRHALAAQPRANEKAL